MRLWVLLFAGALSGAYAQTTGTATLLGTVTDSTGAVVVGAKVAIINVDTAFNSGTFGRFTSPRGSLSDIGDGYTYCWCFGWSGKEQLTIG